MTCMFKDGAHLNQTQLNISCGNKDFADNEVCTNSGFLFTLQGRIIESNIYSFSKNEGEGESKI